MIAICVASWQGKLEVAIELYKKALIIYKKVHGDEHPYVATAMNNIALVYQDQASSCENPPWCLMVRGRPMGVSNPLSNP